MIAWNILYMRKVTGRRKEKNNNNSFLCFCSLFDFCLFGIRRNIIIIIIFFMIIIIYSNRTVVLFIARNGTRMSLWKVPGKGCPVPNHNAREITATCRKCIQIGRKEFSKNQLNAKLNIRNCIYKYKTCGKSIRTCRKSLRCPDIPGQKRLLGFVK